MNKHTCPWPNSCLSLNAGLSDFQLAYVPLYSQVAMSRRQDIGLLSRAISEKEVIIGHRSQAMAQWEIPEGWIWA